MTYKIVIPKEFILTCTYPMCKEHGDIYRHPDWEGETSTKVEFLCEEHAPQVGFCVGCGVFAGGLESFEFAPKVPGYCETCGDAIASEVEDDDEDDDNWEHPFS